MKLNNTLLRFPQNQPRSRAIIALYGDCNTLFIPELHNQQLFVYVHNVLQQSKLLSDVFSNYFTLSCSGYEYETRSKAVIQICRTNTIFSQRSVIGLYKGGTLCIICRLTLQ
jgi:hypothetical protein